MMANDGEENTTYTGSINTDFTYDPNKKIEVPGEKKGRLFKGVFLGNIPIAVKVYYENEKEAVDRIKERQREFTALYTSRQQHPNLIIYYGYALSKTGNNHMFATELCYCSVADIIEPSRKFDEYGRMRFSKIDAILEDLTKKDIILQSTAAVNFLHEKLKISHRNLHPDNFLVACVDPNRDHYVIKLTDIQSCKDLVSINKDAAYSNTHSNMHSDWNVPEDSKKELLAGLTRDELLLKRDSYALGYFYFYVVSGGNLPFKKDGKLIGSMLCDQESFYTDDNWDGGLKKENDKVVLKLVKQLARYKPVERLFVKDIWTKDPYFKGDEEEEKVFCIYDKSPTSKKKKPGLCVIVSQVNYHNSKLDCGYMIVENGVKKYKGVLLDAHTLGDTFAVFGYDVLMFKNLRAKQMETVLSPDFLSQKITGPLGQYASLVVGILGHGDKGVVLGVDEEKVLLNRIQYGFNDESCPELIGKPKIFIILACQGENEQKIKGRDYKPENVGQMWTMKLPMGTSRSLIGEFLTLSATIEEFVTFYDKDEGSAFIKFLCTSIISEYYEREDPKKKRDLVQLFSYEVIPKVMRNSAFPLWEETAMGQQNPNTIKQTPELRSMLTKKILLERTTTIGQVKKVYDGRKEDYLFKIGQGIYNLRSIYSGEKEKQNIWYKFLLYTIYAEAKDEPEECQRAIAWTIRNIAMENNNSIENICKTRSWWQLRSWQNFFNAGNWNKDLEGIDRWLPNVFEELKGHDFSMFSTDYNDSRTNIDLTNSFNNYEKTVKIGNLQFYKEI